MIFKHDRWSFHRMEYAVYEVSLDYTRHAWVHVSWCIKTYLETTNNFLHKVNDVWYKSELFYTRDGLDICWDFIHLHIVVFY